MSAELFSRNSDLKRLRDECYLVQIQGGMLVMREIPYVNAKREVKRGTLVSSLCLAGDVTQRPEPHTIHFDGEYPCKADGTPIGQISHSSGDFDLGNGLRAKHQFSSKPEGGYLDYYHKMTTYASILCGPARLINPDVSPRAVYIPDEDEESVFNYTETASDRVGIGALSQRLAPEKIAIVGLGGTGSYVLDLVSKTPAKEIHLFDGDFYLQHNAFRAPGAASVEELRQVMKKVDYFSRMYSNMRKNIFPHPEHVTSANIHLLDDMTFVFICMDAGEAKRLIIDRLVSRGIGFVDVGMGLDLVDGTLGGILRVTAGTPGRIDHISERVSFVGGGEDDVYSSNIQVADLNSLNASLAVIKWKKIRRFYRDVESEHHCTYTTDGNMLLNGNLI